MRIGMDGKTPPTTSVVVDLEKAVAYELTPGPAGKVILTLHASEDSAPSVAKNSPAPAAKAAGRDGRSLRWPAPESCACEGSGLEARGQRLSKPEAKATKPKAAPAAKPAVAAASAPAGGSDDRAKQPKPEDKKWAMNGKRDPFFSPVVQQQGSGCSTGKKCLEIGAINLRGVVKSDTGFIAVVTNNLNKAYFLRENDPVFNGYVVKITGDSVVFQETIQDKLGKPFTREVVKRIFTPAV